MASMRAVGSAARQYQLHQLQTSAQARAVVVERPAQRRLGVATGVLLAGADLHVQYQAQVAHPEGVQHVAGTLRLCRVAAHLSAL